MSVDKKTKILLVEDATTMRKMEAKILGQIGFTNIVEAVDGNQACAKLESDKDIGLIISDWAMPDMDGYELLLWLRKQDEFSKLPFIMATGHGDKAYVTKAMDAGANGVVAKPFTPDELKVVIDTAFGIEEKKVVKSSGPKVNKEGRVKLKMAHIQITDHLALGILKDQIASGTASPATFELETQCMPSWNPVQKALENGDIDGAFILAPMAMDLFSYDVPIKLTLFAHRNGSVCVRNKEGKYVKPYQQFFKHKTFYIPHKMSIHNMLAHMYFTQMGLRPGVAGNEAVNVLFDVVPPVGMPEFLKENPNDSGFMVAEPIGSRAIAAGIAEKLFLSSEIWEDHPCCVVVFRTEFIDKYHDAVQEFTNLLVEAGIFIKNNIEKAADIAVAFLDPEKKLGLAPELLRNVLSDPQGITTDNLYPVIEDLETIQQYMTSKMEIGRRIDLNDFVDSRFADLACRDTTALADMDMGEVAPGKKRSAAAKLMTIDQKEVMASREGKYLVFNLAEERYGLGIMDVKEIIGLIKINELPDMPHAFKGVVNLRDKVIPVLDMRLKFAMPEAEYHDRTCIIVVEISGIKGSTLMGIIVDSVADVALIKEENIENAPAFGGKLDDSCILGMAKMAEGVTILLDIDLLLHKQDIVRLVA